MSDIYSVIYSSKAMDDLREIYSYIAFALKVPGTAKNQVDRIRKEVRSLNFMPAKYKVVDWEPWQSMKMHQLPVDNYIIFYLINQEAQTVSIVRIVYAGRDLPNIASQDE